MKKLLLLIISLSSLIYAQIDISSLYNEYKSLNAYIPSIGEKICNEYNNSHKANERCVVYACAYDSEKCYLKLTKLKCPVIKENTFYFIDKVDKDKRLSDISKKFHIDYIFRTYFIGCVDTTKYQQSELYEVSNMGKTVYGIQLEKIPHYKEIQWRKE